MESTTPLSYPGHAEWLETDGLGGFAMGTVGLVRTRRYHSLLTHAMHPPSNRVLLVNGFEAWVATPEADYALSSQVYQPGVVQPDGATRIVEFIPEPWPTWRFRLEDGTQIEHELFMTHGSPLVALRWRLIEPAGGIKLIIRPFISGRDYHGVHIENPVFHFTVERYQNKVIWRPYEGLPAIIAFSNGEYMHEPLWYRNFYYAHEHERGLDDTEDLAAPGIFSFNLSAGEAVLLFCPEGHDFSVAAAGANPLEIFQHYRDLEHVRRQGFATPLLRAADQYIVSRGEGSTIIAGYPWFTDWARDTFIALRGLCIATGRLEIAHSILLQWAQLLQDGLFPNAFPDFGADIEYKSVDAPLWFVIAVYEYLAASPLPADNITHAALRGTCRNILLSYRAGTRFNIKMDDDGLIRAGEAGAQLTWMDAKVGDWVVTPRAGKPVEIQALWINALEMASASDPGFPALAARARESFDAKFWNADRQYLFDVVDVDGVVGKNDPSLRPNQVLAAGGLPHSLLSPGRARAVVEIIERELLTPLGLRTLEPGNRAYEPNYAGSPLQRDAVYHQGTSWPWLIGPFAEAWLKVQGDTPQARAAARANFLEPLLKRLKSYGLGHLPEIADAAPPHTPRGCPFQAWSLGELLRLLRLVSHE